MARVDYIRECNDQGVPPEDFVGAFCNRCFQPECGRSQSGKSKFDQRISTWADRLFLNVPKLAPEDPRFAPIASQKFITIDTGRTPEIRSAWVDPNEPQALGAPEVPAPPQESAPVVPRPVLPPGTVPRHMLMANAPSQAGKVLGSGGKSAKRDAWATPEVPAEPVVAPGSRIKLGGSGV